MNTDSVLLNLQIRQLRLYLLAILVYVGIASLVVLPVISKNNTDRIVKAQLSQYLKQADSKKAAAASPVSPIKGAPVSISIGRLGINLPVAPGYYNFNTQKWTLDSKHVFTNNYTDPNPLVGTDQSRVTVLYGHDIPGILVKTSQLAYGDIMTIDTQNGYRFRYYYDKSKVVVPTDTSILTEQNTGDPVILVTCTGTWYQFRHAMYFRLLDVQKISTGQSQTIGARP